MGSKKPKMDVTEYYLSVHFGICAGPVDALLSLIFGEKVGWSGSQSSSLAISISKGDLFGGIKKEGGVSGIAHYLAGDDAQVMPEDLANKLGLTSANCPAYRGISSVFLHGGSQGFYWTANTPYLKSLWAKVTRKPVGLDPGNAMIPREGSDEEDANPAHIIYECLTNTDWGMGSPPENIDISSFLAAAQTLFDEKLGLSMLWSQQSTIEDFVTILINHIEATLFINPRTGLFTLKLIRGDYDIDTLPVINRSNATLSNVQRKLWAETTNEIVVSWTSPVSNETETVSAQDLANIAMQGGIVSDSKDYSGVRSAALAMQLAMRDLRVASSPLVSCQAVVNREAWSVVPGDVVVLEWPEHGIERVVMRVGPVDYGRTTDSKVTLSLVEDVFGLPSGEYTVPPDTAWVSTDEEPAPIEWSLLFTANYYMLMNSGEEVGSAVEPEVAAAVLGAQPGNDTSAFLLSFDESNAAGDPVVVDGAVLNVVSRSLIGSALIFEANSVVSIGSVTQGQGPLVGGFALLGDSDEGMELCIITSVSGGNISLRRGVLDTVPREWPSATPIWFFHEDDLYIAREAHPAGSPVEYSLRSVTSRGVLDYGSANTVGATLTARPWLPSRPANVRLHGFAHGTVDATALSLIPITWARRNRTMEDTVILSWTDADVSPESGQTTTVSVYDLNGILITAHDGIPGTSFDLPAGSFGGRPEGIVRITSKIADNESIQGHQFRVIVANGYGYGYGYNYGGTT